MYSVVNSAVADSAAIPCSDRASVRVDRSLLPLRFSKSSFSVQPFPICEKSLPGAAFWNARYDHEPENTKGEAFDISCSFPRDGVQGLALATTLFTAST